MYSLYIIRSVGFPAPWSSAGYEGGKGRLVIDPQHGHHGLFSSIPIHPGPAPYNASHCGITPNSTAPIPQMEISTQFTVLTCRGIRSSFGVKASRITIT